MSNSNVIDASQAPAGFGAPLAQTVERAVFDLPNVTGAFLFDPEGTTLAAAGADAANDAAVQALVNGLLMLADRTASDLGRGGLTHLTVQGQVGFIVAAVLDSGHGLVLLGSQEARLGLLLHDLEWLAGSLAPSLV